MRLVYNSNSTMYLPALMQIRVARETGWDGIFVRAEHLRRYLAQGYPVASLREALGGLAPVNLGALPDVERWRPDERAAMLREAEALTELAVDVGVSNVQLLTGPVAPGGPYSGPAELSPAELRRVSAEALRAVADLGAPHGIRYYLEPVAWTPLAPSPGRSRSSTRPGATTSGWSSTSGTCGNATARPTTSLGSTGASSPGSTSPIPLGPQGSGTPDQRSRCVWPGEGEIPLREWVHAVRSTGFDGWWDNELYSPVHWEWADPFAVGAGLLEVLRKSLQD